MSRESEARARFEAFHGRAPKHDELIMLASEPPKLILGVGKLSLIGYVNLSDGVTYVHRFRKACRPALYVTSDGRDMIALAGAFRFTDRGFVDKP